MKLAVLLAEASTLLAQAGIADARLDARLLVQQFSDTTQADAIGRPDLTLGVETLAAVRQAIARRANGEPVHRIIGFREFYGLKLFLSAATLEPRPDTETLVDAVVPILRQLAARSGVARLLDLGTGTGAIALALLVQVPEATAVGIDISADALATAERNARENGLSERFEAVRSDWFSEIRGAFDVIVANPPYIRTEELKTLQREVFEHDPATALDGGADGLVAYRTIAGQAVNHLVVGGRLAVEIGHTQKEEVARLFEAQGWRLTEARRDLAGRDRVLVFARG